MQPSPPLPMRQVHLDFHTSEHIPLVAEQFNPHTFAETLAKAHVNSINCFARCHHGWMYYDTQRFPERRHPALKRNLLKEQIEICHDHGIRVPIYVTVQWDQFTANQHPEWLARTADGAIADGARREATKPYEAGFYRALCVNSPYFEFLRAHVEEIFELLPVDGLWFDIVIPLDDSSIWTRSAMQKEGLDPADTAARKAYGHTVIARFKDDMTAHIRQFSTTCDLYYNAGIDASIRPSLDAYTQLEIESLPSGSWGYAHFPRTARYVRTLGKPWLGMTGKFHTEWGDFHSFKTTAALEYECFHALALGGACSIGDQLHPDGAICPTTYDLIGAVYASVKAKEPWCIGAQPVSEIGVFAPSTGIAALTGAVRLLQSAGCQFDVIDPLSDLLPYRVLILPDEISVDPALAARLYTFLADGGSLIASYRSGLTPSGEAFVLDEFGVQLVGDAPYSPDFIVPHGDIGYTLPKTEHVMYMRGLEVTALPGATILAQTTLPYFNRDWRHYCSHMHTPSARQVGYPAVVHTGKVIYFAHPIFSQYQHNAPSWCKQLIVNALAILLPTPLIRHTGPSSLIATLNRQTIDRSTSWIVHLLHYIPARISETIDIIEDAIPLHDLQLTVRTDGPITAVTCVPEQQSLKFEQSGETVRFIVPVVRGHQMIVLTSGPQLTAQEAR